MKIEITNPRCEDLLMEILKELKKFNEPSAPRAEAETPVNETKKSSLFAWTKEDEQRLLALCHKGKSMNAITSAYNYGYPRKRSKCAIQSKMADKGWTAREKIG